jgi:hypothetical protein
VGTVEHDVLPREGEERVGVLLGREEQGRHRLGLPLERALGCRRGLVHVDAVGRDAHQQVRACARAQLAGDGRQAFGRLLRQVLLQRRDDEVVVVLHAVRFGDDAPEPRLWHLVVGAVHEEHVGEAHVAELGRVVDRAQHESLRVLGDVAAVRVRAVEVFAPNP